MAGAAILTLKYEGRLSESPVCEVWNYLSQPFFANPIRFSTGEEQPKFRGKTCYLKYYPFGSEHEAIQPH